MNYKPTLSAFAIFLSTVILASLSVPAVAQDAEPTFALTLADKDWLRYYCFVVPFDSSSTTYWFGEIKLHGAGGSIRINLADSLAVDSTTYAGPERGDNPELAPICRSASFTIPVDADISFFRMLVDDNYASKYPDNPRALELGWHITDTTIFRVLLVRDSDEHVLAVLDSVGTLPKLSRADGNRCFGTSENRIRRSVTISSAFVGTQAHLEILPTWWGYDDFGPVGDCACCEVQPGTFWAAHGMSVKMVAARRNYSAALDSTGTFALNDSIVSSWSTMKFNALIAWEDSVLAATGCIEYPLPLGFDNEDQSARFHKHFGYTPDTDKVTGTVRWMLNHCLKTSPIAKQKVAASETHSDAKTSVVSLKVSSDMIIAALAEKTTTSMQATLYSKSAHQGVLAALISVEGRVIGKVWSGDIAQGMNVLVLEKPLSASGMYYFTVLDRSGQVVCYYKVALIR